MDVLWLLALCIVTGAALWLVLAYRDEHEYDDEFSSVESFSRMLEGLK